MKNWFDLLSYYYPIYITFLTGNVNLGNYPDNYNERILPLIKYNLTDSDSWVSPFIASFSKHW